MTEPPERRNNPALRRRIDELIDRVHDARAEIVERGLNAVRDPDDPDDGGDGAGTDGARAEGAPRAKRPTKDTGRDGVPDGAGG
jgi:hypothetical protein